VIPAILNDLGRPEELAWLTFGYSVGGLCIVLPLGKLYELYDAKWVYISCGVSFMIGSALCGAAPTMDVMIVGRVIAGMGGNGLYLGVVTLMTMNTTEREAPVYLSLLGLVWGLGLVLGPIVGGGLEIATWRWAFYLNLCIGGLLAPVWVCLIPDDKTKTDLPLLGRLRGFDVLGSCTIIVGTLCLTMALSFGGTLFAWSSAPTIIFFVVGLLGLLAFLLQQHFLLLTTDRDRLFPMHFWRLKDPVLLFVISAAADVMTFTPIYYIPLYFQFARSDSPLTAAFRLLPYIASLSLTFLANGYLMSASGRFKPWYIIGSALALTGSALLSIISADTSNAAIYGFEVLAGFVGAFDQAGFPVIFALVEERDVGFATSFIMLAQLAGTSVGLAIGSAVFINLSLGRVSQLLPGASMTDIENALTGVTGGFLQGVDEKIKMEVLDVIVGSLRQV